MADARIASLRDVLASRGHTRSEQPDDDVMSAMLDIEGDIDAAARSIDDAQAAERRRLEDAPQRQRAVSPLRVPPVSRAQTLSGIWGSGWLATLWRWVSMPFSVLHFLAMIVLRSVGLTSRAPNGRDTIELSRFNEDPREAARRWILELERDTGGTSVPDESAQMRIALPNFFAGSYSDALREAKQQIQILVVVLTSTTHTDAAYFRTEVLTDAALVAQLRNEEFCVWGGDVQAREAFQVSRLLEASTYPFIAFIALQPRRSRSRGGALVAHPAVLSRMEGSPRTNLGAMSILAHIQDIVLPRTRTYLGSLRSERQHREMERELKAAQDRAYAEASKRDHERVLKRRAEEEQRAAHEQSKLSSEAAARAQQEKAMQWRCWARTNLVPLEPGANVAPQLRVAVHTPDGQNLQRRFSPTDTLEQVYAYVDTADVAGDHTGETKAPQDYVHRYAFDLVQTYPRRVLDKTNLQCALQDVHGFGPSANLVVEGMHDSAAADLDSSDEE